MIFRSDKYSATWDTWMFYHQCTYYLYYLITENSPGEGFGVATSKDGIHWEDHGLVISASDKMVYFLGTGSVWKSINFENDSMFICNYSEWRMEGDGCAQAILFARSTDLIHWEKLGDDFIFRVDDKKYKKYIDDMGRWDTICVIDKKGGGYYGYLTATPINFMGCGFASSDDGLHWLALEPVEIKLEQKGFKGKIEVSAVYMHNHKYFCIAGKYNNQYGMCVLISDNPKGPFIPSPKNFALIGTSSFMHAYFFRFFETDEGLFVNHHVIKRETNDHNRSITYLAPIKRAIFDEENILRLVWWKDNEGLKGALLEPGYTGKSVIIEGRLSIDGEIALEFAENESLTIKVDNNCRVEIFEKNEEEASLKETCEKHLVLPGLINFRLLIMDTMLELYINDYYITSYTANSNFKRLAQTGSISDVMIWELSI